MANVPTLLTSADLSASQTSGAPASVSSTTIIQANTFAIGNWLYLNGSTYALAKANSANTASVVGIVSAASSTQFTLTTSGLVTGLSGLTVGANYFLSPTTSGAITTTEPTTTGYVSAPVGIATSATSIQVAIDRGTIVRNAVTTFTVGGSTEAWYPVVFNRSGSGTDFDFRITRDVNQTFSGSGYCNFRLYGNLAGNGAAVPTSAYEIAQSITDTASFNIDNDAVGVGSVGGYSLDPYGNRITVWLRGGRDYYLNNYFGYVTLETINISNSITSFSYAGGGIYTVYSGYIFKGFGGYDYKIVYLHDQNNQNASFGTSATILYTGSPSQYCSANIEVNYLSARNNIGCTNLYATNYISVNGIFYVYNNGEVNAGKINAVGYGSRPGLNGFTTSNFFNIYWTGSAARLYIDNTNLGNISVTSDYRIKKNIETQDSSAIDRIAKIRPVKYEFADYKELFKEDGVQREGFIAHELQEVIPSAVDGEKDAEDQIQSLKLDALCSVMVKAIQEQQAMIDALKAEVELLKNK